jgi:ferric-dicitrate binding protein FerR (iron transport regulator)
MERNHLNCRQLARYMAGQSSRDEVESIRSWVNADEYNGQFLEEVQIIWDAAGTSSDQRACTNVDVDGDWESLKKRMRAADSGRRQIEDPAAGNGKCEASRNEQPSRTASNVRQMLRVAALVALLVGGAIIFDQFAETPAAEQAGEVSYQQITTDPGQRATVRLGDGTRVVLNVDSELRVPRAFDREIRRIELEGEAYFDVASDGDRPFRVESERATVTVLGTRFGMRAYANGQTRVVVEEGQVSMASAVSSGSTPVDLRGGHIGELTGDSAGIAVSQVNATDYLSWREGRLTFRETPLSEVMVTLERWYDIEGKFRDDSIRDRQLTASLTSKSLQDVLDVISVSLNVDYRIEGRTVVFTEPSATSADQAHIM